MYVYIYIYMYIYIYYVYICIHTGTRSRWSTWPSSLASICPWVALREEGVRGRDRADRRGLSRLPPAPPWYAEGYRGTSLIRHTPLL